MLLCNQKKICIKRKIKQSWKKGYPFSLYLKTNFKWNCFPKVPLEIILVHVQREQFTFTIGHSISNISSDAYSYLKCRKKRARVLKIQFMSFFIWELHSYDIKWCFLREFLKMWKSGWPGLLSPVTLAPSPIIPNVLHYRDNPPPRLCGRKLILHCFGKITSL